MDPFLLRLIREPLSRADLSSLAAKGFGDMIKAVVGDGGIRSSIRRVVGSLVRDA